MRRLLLLLVLLPLIAVARPPVVLVLGDSLSAGYGISTDDGWVRLLQERIDREGLPHQVVNASISGETSSGGLTRLPPLMKEHRPAVLVIELGANDGLRGIPFRVLRKNLEAIIRTGRDGGSKVLLLGVRLPPNYGAVYTQAFQGVFAQVAEETGVALVPTFLAGIAEHRELMQSDGLHPKAEAQGRILDNVWPALAPLLEASAGAGG